MNNLETHNKIKETAEHIIQAMNISGKVEVNQNSTEAIMVSISSPEHGRLLIGRNGQNLQALEHVLRAVAAKTVQSQAVVVDINDYRKSRETYVLDLARQAVHRVRSTGKSEALIPMNAYERRVVHMELASAPDIATESVGQDPQRRIVIKPYRI